MTGHQETAPSRLTARTLPVATAREARRELWRVLRPERCRALLAVLILVVTVGAGLLIPPALGEIVDIADGGGPRQDLLAPLLVLVAATLAQGVAASAGWYLVVQVGEAVLARLRERVLGHALSLPRADLERAGIGDLVSRVSNDVDKVSTALRTGFPELIWSGATAVLTLVGLAVLDWRFALAGLASLPFYLWATHGYTVVSPPLYVAERHAEGVRSQALVETLGGARTIQALLLGPRHLQRTASASEAARQSSIRAADTTAWFFSRIHLAELVGTGTVLVVGAWLVGDGAASLGEATAAALYFIRLYDPVGAMVNLLDEVQSATASLRRLAGILQVELDLRPGGPTPSEPSLALRGVRFGYDDGPDILHGVDLDVRPGEHVALVGASGAGKTTAAALAAGIHEPRAGTIELGGVGIALMTREELSARLTLVTQEVHIFSGTLAQDLRLARHNATDEQLRQALEEAGALPWVERLPHGLETRVGAGGHPLTPVQSQQVALARLVLRDPDIAVLDEATAEAGSTGARELEASLARVLQKRTALLVAHRLSTAAAADRVVLLYEGRVLEEGPHTLLLARGGEYAELWKAWQAPR
ncbi:MAG: ABC transporter ATP-binding protein [Phycicoccus sp.]